MDFSGISSKGYLGKLLRLPLLLVPKSSIVPILQGPLRGKWWIVGSSNHGCWLGSYELSKQKRFIEEVKFGDVIYDIGAHVGFYSLLGAEIVGSKGMVVSFEPLPSNLEYLKRHISLNQMNNIRVIEKAVSSHSAVTNFAVEKSSSMGYLSPQSTEATIEVEMVSLDECMLSENLPLPNVIKVDVEGSEFDFLVGASQLLASNSVKVFLATHGVDIHKKCLTFLKDLGYELESLTDKSLEETDEIFAFKVI